MYWHKLVEEVLNKNKKSNDTTNKAMEAASSYHTRPAPITNNKQCFSFAWGSKLRKSYFTPRETQCMIQILQGYTIKNISKELRLSPRTIEFYLKNMKHKVRCRTKYQLIDTILGSNFLQNVNKEKEASQQSQPTGRA